ncbi:MAG: nucleoside-diphosphate sugar epimerase [Desulfuromonas sp.]|uniref:polysaccharide biosynthesis protein n=1 Tax=Desulfuromonas sp. TaxID=892 RepID=UPI000CA94280|nr:nucleoside-diphosphate sugar epimerase/dehydratase [Desulfuromonas sp.]PLX86058.1 MAG: nucleoside-diphosphate sugar epimerase [Desulfuromonas sp.]
MIKLEALVNKNRKFFVLSFDLILVATAFLLAFAVRFDLSIPGRYWTTIGLVLPLLMATKMAVFWGMGIFGGWWRYVSVSDMLVILKANIIGSLVFSSLVVFVWPFGTLPKSVLILDGILCFLFFSGVRIFTRICLERYNVSLKGKTGRQKRILIVGAGAVGQTIVREVRQCPKLKGEVVGFLDSDPQRLRKRFQGVSVLGAPNDLQSVWRKKGIDLVIIAQQAVDPKDLRTIMDFCQKTKVEAKILPPVGDIIGGGVSIQHIRDVELEDLLGREPVRLDVKDIQEYLRGKRILVSGAGGSIGSEICRQVAGFMPESIVLFDQAETPLFQIEKELAENYKNVKTHPTFSDIRDRSRVEFIFEKFKPQVVFHAAAYKHVPLSEQNPIGVVENNVLGTRILADAANLFGVQHFVMVSTDKAVNPTNTMGASKRVAEIYVQNMARQGLTQFVTVRFGNVLGSSGSVVPIFKEQIKRGGPVTVTHPEVIRFFMTIPEAVQLVLQAGSMGKGGEIFLLDMGEPVKIVQMAEEMIRLSGFRSYEDIDIVFTGLRPGEKLYEELVGAGEGVLPTDHEKIRVVRATSHSSALLGGLLERLDRAIQLMDREEVLNVLEEIVPEYQPERDRLARGKVVKPVPVRQAMVVAMAGPEALGSEQ